MAPHAHSLAGPGAAPSRAGAAPPADGRHRSVCPYCGVGCGLVMEVAGGKVVKVSGDKDHPANAGRLCTKGASAHVPLTAPGRADRAYARQAGGLAAIGLDAAITRAAEGLQAIIARDGPDAVALYVSGQMSLEAQYLANKLAKGFIGTNNIESNSRLCMASAASGYKLSLGADGPPGSYEDFDKADLFFIIGANMADCHPILFLRMMERVKQGARLIVVDPRRTATAEKADLFLQLRPGSDLALMNGLLHLLVAGGHTDAAFIAQHTEGWEQMPAFLADYPPERVAALTGLAEADLRQAAQWIGAARNWMSCWTMGLNQSTQGTWNTNAICNLHLATGAMLRPGAGPFSLTGQPNAMGGREMGYMGAGLPGQRATTSPADRAFVEAQWGIAPGTLRPEGGGGTLGLFDAMAAGQIKACWIICTNPVATVANRQRVIAGLEAAELVITQDAFLDTETNRYADLLLPGALWAEAEGVMVNSERNLTLMPQAVPPPGAALPDWQIIARVACAMGYEAGFTYASAAEVFDEIRRFANPATGYDLRGASHQRLREGPLQWPCPPGGAARNPIRYRAGPGGAPAFPTSSGKARFFARPHMAPAELPDADYPLVLNTGRLQHQWHTLTKTGKVPTLTKLNPGPFVEIHPADAAAHGLAEGDRVELRSRRGRAVLPARITDRVQPGNCWAPFHWNDLFGADCAVNAVTSDALDPISLQPAFKFSAVALTRLAAPEPAMTDTPDALSTDALSAFARLLGLPEAMPRFEPAEQQYLAGFTAGLRLAEPANGGLRLAEPANGAPLLPASAPIAAERRLFVEGLLAGLFAPRHNAASAAPAAPVLPTNARSVLVAFASQTGNAEAFARQAAATLTERGLAARLTAFNEISPAALAEAGTALLITSTFGDGDPPDNGAALWQALAGENAPAMAGLTYAVLGFGDANYEQFCGFARRLDDRLAALGGQRLTARADCEADAEAAMAGWLARALEALGSDDGGDNDGDSAASGASASPPPPAAPGLSRQAPLLAPLVTNRLLSGAGSQKEVRQFGFDLSAHALPYQAGDALGVWPVNDPALVGAITRRLGLAAEAPVTLPGGQSMALAEALARHCEIARPAGALLQQLAAQDRDAPFAPLLAPERRAELDQWLWGRQTLDTLQATRAQIDAQTLVDSLRALQPRLYSISSSPKACPQEVQLTVSVVRWLREGAARQGVCSAYLADRASDAPVPVFLQPTAHFRPPANPDAPMIMVGPGTGIAPFRGFLQDRQADGARGRNWLFFGEQTRAHDFYYQTEIETWQRDGHLSRLDLAFSRDGADKLYVQHLMARQGAELWRWLDEGAHFYVCGDGARMARDVDAALHAIVAQHGGMSAQKAEAFIADMKATRRYVRDVY